MQPKKPGYNSTFEMEKMVTAVCSFFGRVYTDSEQERSMEKRGHRKNNNSQSARISTVAEISSHTINETAAHFHISPQKVRKLLITGGHYDTVMSRKIRSLNDAGKSVDEIAATLKICVTAVRSYLPYERVVYKLPERSVNADRCQRFKEKWGGYKKTE